MEIIILGTSSGTPTRSRNVSGIAVKGLNSKSWYLIDCGEATQHQLLRTRLSLNSLRTIFITHVHGDHCYGLPGLLASATMSGRTESLSIVAPKPLERLFEVIQETTQLRLSYEVRFIDIETPVRSIDSEEFVIDSISLSHRVPSYAYSFTEKQLHRNLDIAKLERLGVEPGPAWGEIQKGRDVNLADGRTLKADDYLLETRLPQRIVIGGDNDTPELLSTVSDRLDVLVHEATYTEDVAEKVGSGPQHSSAKRVCQFAQQSGVRNLVLTHFSPRYQDHDNGGLSIKDIEKEARAHYDGNLFLARDLDRYLLNKEGLLVKQAAD